MPNSGDDHPSVSCSAPCGEPYVLKIETAGLHVVSEDVPVLQLGPTDKRRPARQYPTVPEDVTPEPAAEIAEELNEDDWDQRDLCPARSGGPPTPVCARRRV